MPPITNIEDLRAMAQRRVPRTLLDYVESGSYEQSTLAANRNDLAALRLRQRVLIDVSRVSLETSLLGEKVSLPVAIAPTGLTGLIHGDGEILAARAAEAAGTKYSLSTMSICSIEDVRSAVHDPFWFQLYVFRDRGFSRSVVERAIAARCPVLFVTVDLPMRGQRHADIKNGLTVPPRLTFRNAWDIASKPTWALGILFGKRKTFGNIEAYLRGGATMREAGAWANEHFDRALSWRDIDWLREMWPGKLVLKGVMDVEDARTAAAAGVDGIVVSNHGGRQLDGARSTIAALPEIAQAVGDRIEVLFDGGIRTGQDVLKALALGARGCLLGRAHLYGLAAMGEAGVTLAIEIIRRELEVTMALCGLRDLNEISRDVVLEPERRN